MKKWNKVVYLIAGVLIILWIYVDIKQNLGNQQAAESGICIKARPSAIMFRSTTYTIDVVYQYNGEKYRGEVFTTVKSKADSIRQKPDSIWIKILPENPHYLTWCEQR